ncbi:MAG: FkbM family methyltransferase [Phycisphaerales bacterium]
MPLRFPIPLLRLFASHELPFKDALLARAGVWSHEPWRHARPRTCRGKWHGSRMTFDLRDFHQRAAYLFGRLMDVPVQLAILNAARPGDIFVDVGANIGVLTLLGAHAVGPAGTVIAFEPNPEVFKRLDAHVRDNRRSNVRLFPLALSDREGVLQLSIPPTGNTGAATLGTLPARHGGRAHARYDVPVKLGDDLLGDAPPHPRPMLVKIDAEGHEPNVLRGMSRTIAARRPAILAEINPEALAGNGATPADALDPLLALGYRPHYLGARWGRWSRRWTLVLRPAPTVWRSPRAGNLLLLPADGPWRDRLARRMA